MIHSEKGRTQMKGNTLDIFSDFRAVNIAMRQFLKNQGATKETINEIMIAEIFRAAEDEDAGVVLKNEQRLIINKDVRGKDAGKEGGSEDGLPV